MSDRPNARPGKTRMPERPNGNNSPRFDETSINVPPQPRVEPSSLTTYGAVMRATVWAEESVFLRFAFYLLPFALQHPAVQSICSNVQDRQRSKITRRVRNAAHTKGCGVVYLTTSISLPALSSPSMLNQDSCFDPEGFSRCHSILDLTRPEVNRWYSGKQ